MKKVLNLILVIVASIIFFSCKKENSIGLRSNWTLTAMNKPDSGYFNSYQSNFIFSSASWDSIQYVTRIPVFNYFVSVDGWGAHNKSETIIISFTSLPKISGIYKIGINPRLLTDSTCNISVKGVNYNLYNSTTPGQPVNVTIADSLINVSFNNISLTGTDSADVNGLNPWAASISGKIYQGK